VAYLLLVLVLGFAAAGSAGSGITGLPLVGEDAVQFLLTADVEGRPKQFDALAITDPLQVTLKDGNRTLKAIFKDENTRHMQFRFADGRTLTRIKDSYKNEIAAYELDTMLGLGIVPPCVERRIERHTGALCLWVKDAMTEAERIHKKIRPPSTSDWNDQMFTIRFFQQLIWDPDFNNVRNLLVDADFKIYKIDCSMAFLLDPKLRKEESLTRFSRKALASLESLERSELDKRLGPWLSQKRLEALWKRRSRLLELASELVAARGEGAVLFD
jgi:hypothetical protein